MQDLLEAVPIEKGEIPIEKKEHMSAPAFIASDIGKGLIEEAVNLRKEKNISQSKLAELTGNKQQAISPTGESQNFLNIYNFFYICYYICGNSVKKCR